MNVFVLSPGRTGTTSLAKGFGLALGMTAGHESRVRHSLATRVDYPENHIECDNRLVHYLHLLDKVYPDAAYVRVVRDRDEVAESYAARWWRSVSIVKSHGQGTLMHPGPIHRSERLAICRDYVDLCESRLDDFVAGKTSSMLIRFESLVLDFETCWRELNLTGSLNQASSIVGDRSNANVDIGLHNYVRHLRRALGGLG